ncbi:hypothetical protein LCGC14_0730020 [marine sediment metagenome]|uniref:HEPN domain-containing protein n=1 Tax=marine sediment metagenome TaxID=412755 RepID=A0A0F9SV76_9ZZZZ
MDEFTLDWIIKMNFWNSHEGKEVLLCMLSQGYEGEVFAISLFLYSSAFAAHDIIKGLRELF